MSVHVGEMHTDVRPGPDAAAAPSGRGSSATGVTAQEVHREACARLEQLTARTASEAFDD